MTVSEGFIKMEKKVRTIQLQIQNEFEQLGQLDDEDSETRRYLQQRMLQDFHYLVSTLDQLFESIHREEIRKNAGVMGYLESFIEKDNTGKKRSDPAPSLPEPDSSVYDSEEDVPPEPVESDTDDRRKSRRLSRQSTSSKKAVEKPKRKKAIDPSDRAEYTPAKRTRKSEPRSRSTKKSKPKKREVRDDNGLSVVNLAGGSGTKASIDGAGEAAKFEDPAGITISVDGYIYVTDNDKIRKISKEDGQVVTFVDSKDSELGPCEFVGISHRQDGHLFVTDWRGRVMGVTPDRVLYEIAGCRGVRGDADGEGDQASFNGPSGIVVAADGTIKVTEAINGKVRTISPMGVVSTDPIEPEGPSDIVINSKGVVYVSEVSSNRISYFDEDGNISVFAGSGLIGDHDGIDTEASFNYPSAIAIDTHDNIYVADMGNNVIRKITPAGVVTTIAGSGSKGKRNGPANVASFNAPGDLVVDEDGTIYVIDTGALCIRKICKDDGSGAQEAEEEERVDDSMMDTNDLVNFDFVPTGDENGETVEAENGDEEEVTPPENQEED